MNPLNLITDSTSLSELYYLLDFFMRHRNFNITDFLSLYPFELDVFYSNILLQIEKTNKGK